MSKITDALKIAVSKVGEQAVLASLVGLSNFDKHDATLTIIANDGIHKIPDAYIHGECYIASAGNIDLHDAGAIQSSYVHILNNLAAKLREKPWTKIYLITTGPVTLCLQIKMLIYHITRIASTDLHYHKGNYCELEMDYRSYLLGYENAER